VEKPVPSHELTSTLHLGVRSVSDSSPIALIESLISESSAEDQRVLTEVMSGNGESAMVFIHRGPARGARFLITATGASIGRSPESDIFLDDVTVSRTHARIEYREKSFTFNDLGSLNGSYINNQQTSSHRLATGDEIQIGKFHMLFIGATAQSGEK
jgi:pSer/pThr/pTyr-binding forkhead associated (FHA) protein